MSDPQTSSPVITEADLDALSQRALLRTIDVVRRASTVLFVIAAVLALAWLWLTLRTQGLIGNSDEDGYSPTWIGEYEMGFKERLDFLATTVEAIGTAALVAGLGLGLRAYCDVATLRAGGTLTGWELGDSVDPEAVELDES